jgi:hypothetical protein
LNVPRNVAPAPNVSTVPNVPKHIAPAPNMANHVPNGAKNTTPRLARTNRNATQRNKRVHFPAVPMPA